jgi:hypothetical protein
MSKVFIQLFEFLTEKIVIVAHTYFDLCSFYGKRLGDWCLAMLYNGYRLCRQNIAFLRRQQKGLK